MAGLVPAIHGLFVVQRRGCPRQVGADIVVMRDILTDDELWFLTSVSLAPDDVFDARGMPQWLWRQRAKREGKPLALGNRCTNGGHRLKTHGGHCVQCDPKKLAYQRRFSAEQYVYIAGSRFANLIKVGTCIHCGQREGQLRSENYGGVGDWEIIYSIRVRNAGEIEHQTRSRLLKYVAPVRSYWKDHIEQCATELLLCSFSRARRTLEEVAADAKIGEPWKQVFAYMYEFDEPQ